MYGRWSKRKGLTGVANMLYKHTPRYILGWTISTQGISCYLPWAHCEPNMQCAFSVPRHNLIAINSGS